MNEKELNLQQDFACYMQIMLSTEHLTGNREV